MIAPCLGCDTPCEEITMEWVSMETGEPTTITAPVCEACQPLLGYLLLNVE